ncbi:nitrogen regulatory protein P-II 1 [Aquimarina sp. EL_43]|uniref:P-II family nitrogen regulator n=1 Tax=unclassified Aquimarina TaxID=2627091 RepID=UPI0018C99EA0|nr:MULTISPECIES: P-II family nitrogen regulator [unclassified Aquimarina]MBG6132488.1 nitrogen regulatory protein P-II 1 [Aquimarina sp. EL_35]MBG6152619.1 nitrogen regulatory protein P-II 1 [Aquimarina sp. EL_32]MBG6170454.1 nitrogen regulatory protein P-II 1 [Aquimarina sp. EL_43]
MKKIEAIIRKSKFEAVKEALHKIEVNFFTYWDVTGVGNEKKGRIYRGTSYNTSDIPRSYLSIVVCDEFEEKTIRTLIDSAKTGEVGDGKIFVSNIQDAYRIRTEEKGNQALH